MLRKPAQPDKIRGMTDHIRSLHVLGSRQFGGADHFFVRLACALTEAGHPTLAVTRPNSPAGQALDRSGVEHAQLPLANKWDIVSSLRLRSLVRRWQPDVVQTYMGRATRLVRLPRPRHAMHVARLGGYYKIDGYYRHADAWVGNTQGICDYLVHAGLRPDRIFKIGNFVPDPELLPPGALELERAKLDLPEDAWVLFSLGRFVEKKGFGDLLDALGRLPAKLAGRSLHLVLAGDGPEKAALSRLAASLELEDRVHWLGWTERASLYYQLCDAMICPSREEPLGNVILETWRHGKPIVSTRTAGALELIEDGVDGLVAPVGEPVLLAARIRELLEADDATRQAISESGMEKCRRDHSREAVLDAYLALYRALLAARGD